MKRGSTKFLPLVSVVALLFSASATAAQEDAATKIPRTNEMTLAGLRPGRDTLADAERKLHLKLGPHESGAAAEWHDSCTGKAVKLELDAKGVIQSVTISSLGSDEGPCTGHREVLTKDWQTGHGLRLGDPQNRVLELYGDANSAGPSVKGQHELELLYYAFDWAGSDVPQVMEILCARDSGRVMEITLAYPSL